MIRLRHLVGLAAATALATPAAAEPVKFNGPTVKLYDKNCISGEKTQISKLPPLTVDETVQKKAGCITLRDAAGNAYYVMQIPTTDGGCGLTGLRSPDRPSGSSNAGSRGAGC